MVQEVFYASSLDAFDSIAKGLREAQYEALLQSLTSTDTVEGSTISDATGSVSATASAFVALNLPASSRRNLALLQLSPPTVVACGIQVATGGGRAVLLEITIDVATMQEARILQAALLSLPSFVTNGNGESINICANPHEISRPHEHGATSKSATADATGPSTSGFAVSSAATLSASYTASFASTFAVATVATVCAASSKSTGT